VLGASISISAQPRRYDSRGITVFTNPDFRGDSVTFRNDTPDLRGYGLNDKISSIDVPNGETWEICQDINYGNRCQVLFGSISNLRDMGWNDRISSLRRVAGAYSNRGRGGVFSSRGSQSLRFYERTDFRGSSTLVTSESPDLSFVGRPRSVEVQGGAWELCDRSGRCATVTRDVSDLAQLGLRDRLRSANLLNDRDNGRNRGNSNSKRRDSRWP
jgi:hypothetical protein